MRWLLWLIMPIVLVFLIIVPAYAQPMDTTKAVIHHTASHDVSAETIDGWHRERGFDGIGYHFVIRADGDIEHGRSITKLGAHAKGRNDYIGIVLTGHDMFTQSQIASLKKLIKDLGITHIERHHEQCPGKGLNLEEML